MIIEVLILLIGLLAFIPTIFGIVEAGKAIMHNAHPGGQCSIGSSSELATAFFFLKLFGKVIGNLDGFGRK